MTLVMRLLLSLLDMMIFSSCSYVQSSPSEFRIVGIRRADCILIGQLDGSGEFRLTRVVPIPTEQTGSNKAELGVTTGKTTPHELINAYSLKRAVYEYRSNTLIPGSINREGYFVPEIGGKIIAFQEYRFGFFSPPIWNLPGRFVPVKPALKAGLPAKK
jgi:hypothetical protein